MKYIRRLLQIFCILVLANGNLIWKSLGERAVFGALLWLCYLVIHIKPCGFFLKKSERSVAKRIQILKGGYEQILVSCLAIFLQFIWVLMIAAGSAPAALQPNISADSGKWESLVKMTGSCLFVLALCYALSVNAYLRIVICSNQLKLVWKIAMVFLWWIPVFNLFLIRKVSHVVRLEYQMEISKEELNAVRAENEICKTKYPIIMVHGIFFRDWQIFNYWGRIPAELMRNGASVYYGKQQSAQSIEGSAKELKQQIMGVLQETHSEKVNIIAHSKGGLDSRYAISCLGMDEYVASLTTINTPHMGCLWVDDLLKKLPESLIRWVTKKYNTVFTVLGDEKPDFYGGLMDLTAKRCEKLNEQMPDRDNVYYQSSMSVMSHMFSDGFPLWLSYFFAKRVEGENDGLVSVKSSKWGHFLGTVSTKGKRGVSHGDVIDLRRENVKGYDVREYYVKLVADLKERGF